MCHILPERRGWVNMINPPRNVPFGMKDKLKKELDKMTKMRIIKPKQEPTGWVNSLIIVEKVNGSLRFCLDPKDLNKAIKGSTTSCQQPKKYSQR